MPARRLYSPPTSLSSPDSRANDRLARLLGQRQGPDTIMIGVLVIAVILGLVGFALHILWVVAVIVMALGLGYAVANSRRNKIDVVNQHADEQAALDADEQTASDADEYQTAAAHR
jgi:Flp pilus assembly protein TadB